MDASQLSAIASTSPVSASTAGLFTRWSSPAASSSSTRTPQLHRTHFPTITPPKFPASVMRIQARHHRRIASGISAVQQAFFESSVVQAESERLQADYTSLLKLGRKYGKFDRDGKVFYIQEMKTLIERWHIFVKRMELVDDIAAKAAVHKLRSEVGPLGLSSMDLADSIFVVLDEMKKDAEAEVETIVS